MKSVLSFLAILNSVSAFNVQSIRFSRQLTLVKESSSSTHHELERFERALECAEKFGSCDIEQMEELAKELDEFHGSLLTQNPSMMKKENSDRKDVAQVLRLQAELRLRMEYLNGANLFASEIHELEDSYPEHQ